MNKFICTGRIVNDPELKMTTNQISVLSFTVAVKRPRTKEVADFLPCVAWRQNAEFLSKFAHKGDMVGITGILTSRNWEDRDGHKRTSLEIQCDDVELLSPKKQEAQNTAPTYSNQDASGFEEIGDEEELPF